MTKICLGYGRQSVSARRDDRDGGSISIAFQRKAAEEWCERNDAKLVGWFMDVDESGASTTRAGMDALLAETTRLRPDVVLFWDVKRLARNLKYFLTVFDVMEAANAELVSCTEGTRHPALVWKMLALFAEEERDRIAVNITQAIRESAKRGRHHGYAPLGYRLTESSDLVPDPETRWIVEWMYARALEGMNPTAICRRANAEGVPTATPRSLQWTREAVARLLTTPTYGGLIRSGAKSTSRYGKTRPIVEAVGTHEPIIPPDRWRTVQEAVAGRSRPSKRIGSDHWLAGRVRCAACGSRLYYVDAGRQDKPWRDRYWRCAASYATTFGRDLGIVCPSPKNRIADSALTAAVIDALGRALRHGLTPDEVVRRIDDDHAAAARRMREGLERELAELQRQRMNIADAIQKGSGLTDLLAERDRQLIADLDRVQASLAAVPAEPDRMAIAETVVRSEELAEALADSDDAARAVLAVELGLRVTVDLARGTATLAYRDGYDWLG